MTPVLITIPFSHFCEKARWALNHAGVAFVERGHAPLLHVPAVKRVGGQRSVPTLQTEEGTLCDSTDILAWADARASAERKLLPTDPALRDEVLALEDDFDRRLGVASRHVFYSITLKDLKRVRKVVREGIPGFERFILPALMPVAARVIRRVYRITPERTEKAYAKVRATFDEVEARLADGRPYLCGDRFTAADLTFAALAAPTVAPPEYGVPLPEDDLPEGLRPWLDECRARPAGQFALRLYREHRHQ
ncbi:MAG: glutathione S-transferase [Myxococcales bacterium]|nr:glutathione S-transferase [Myxococcales bacterium]